MPHLSYAARSSSASLPPSSGGVAGASDNRPKACPLDAAGRALGQSSTRCLLRPLLGAGFATCMASFKYSLALGASSPSRSAASPRAAAKSGVRGQSVTPWRLGDVASYARSDPSAMAPGNWRNSGATTRALGRW